MKNLGIAGIGVGVGYIGYKAYKQFKKDQEEAMKEAKDYIEKQEKEMQESDPADKDEEERSEEEIVKATHEEEAWKAYIAEEEAHQPAAKKVEEKRQPVLSTKVYNITRGVDTLRYDANSEEAFEQYKAMMLSDYELDPDVHEVVGRMFAYTIGCVNRRDMIIRERILEDRTRFFGKDSRFITDITIAEVFIFYADKLNDDIGMDIIEAMRILLDATDITIDSDNEQIEAAASDLSSHCFWNYDGTRYGLFGLLEEEYDRLYEFPEVAVTKDQDISYDMEYSVFIEYYGDELIEEQLNGQC